MPSNEEIDNSKFFMKFFTKYGGITTHTPWKRPTSKVIREWRDELSFDLTDWFVVGNVVELEALLPVKAEGDKPSGPDPEKPELEMKFFFVTGGPDAQGDGVR